MVFTKLSPGDISRMSGDPTALLTYLEKELEEVKIRLIHEKDDTRFYQGIGFFIQSLLKDVKRK